MRADSAGFRILDWAIEHMLVEHGPFDVECSYFSLVVAFPSAESQRADQDIQVFKQSGLIAIANDFVRELFIFSTRTR
jgi:hypothetical protein